MENNYTETEYFEKIVTLFDSVGITRDKCIEVMEQFNKKHRYTVETFYRKAFDLINYFKNMGIKENKIGSIITRFYPIFTYDLNLFNNNLKRLSDIGFSEADITKMVTLSPTILALKNKVGESFNYLQSLGYTKEETLDIIRKAPNIISHSKEYIQNRIDYYKSMGMNDEDALKVIKRAPTLIKCSNEALDNRIEELIKIGFKREELYSILRVNPAILALTNDTIMEKINYLVSIGFTKEEAIKLYSYQKTMFTIKLESIKDKIEVLKACKYTLENIRDIISKYPGITTLNGDSIKDKITFYDSLGLHNIIVREPKNLMQSLHLSKARNNYFIANGISINESNYKRLFMGEKSFTGQFKKTNKEVIDAYGLNKR
jgi:DNA-binding transcriptional regulator YhcF (GntR family)